MKAELLKRLFRAIAETQDESLYKLSIKIIEDEKTKGHTTLAGQLESVIQNTKKAKSTQPTEPKRTVTKSNSGSLSELPTSRRYQEPLATSIPYEKLRHHMVLPTEIEERFHTIECEYAARQRLAKYGLSYKKKIMLYGPPGCGKSLGAERLAWNTGLPLMKVRFDSIISSYFGESAANLRSVFEASKEVPCLLLLDECDFIARSRTNKQDVGEAPRIVNTLLQLLEEYDAPGLLVATTNLQDSLDNAIFRRFDDVFEVPRPGKVEVKKLMSMALSALEVSDNINWPKLIEQLSGYSAANIVAIAQDAAKQAILAGEAKVNQLHIESIIAKYQKMGHKEDGNSYI